MNLTRCTLVVMTAPIFSGASRMEPQDALAKRVFWNAMRRRGAGQDIGHRGEPQAELVGPHGVRRSAIPSAALRAGGEQVHLAFLDAVSMSPRGQ